MKKNYRIQLYRFLAALVLMIHHLLAALKVNTGGYICVEFFYIISGFLLASKVFKLNAAEVNAGTVVSTETAAKEAWTYSKKKYLKLFPYAIIAFAVMFIGVSVIMKYSPDTIAKNFLNSFWEINMLFMSGIGGSEHMYNGQIWFASALIIAGYFVYFLLRKKPHLYSRIICPLSVMLIYSIFYNKYKHICLAATFDADISVELAFIRAFAGLNLGIICYLIYDRYKDCKPSANVRLLLSAAELLAFAFVIAMIFMFNYSVYDFMLVAVLAVLIVLAFLNFGYGRSVLENKFVDFLGKLSMPLFINHVFVYSIILRGYIRKIGWEILVYYIITIAISAVEYLIIESIRKSIAKKRNKAQE